MGDEIAFRVDANEGWSIFEARDALHDSRTIGVEFVEQPIDMHNIGGLADLRSKTRVRIAANQSVWLPTQVPDVIAQRAADVIVTDPHQLGGLVPFRNAMTMCETAGLPVIKHAFGDLGITTIATAHVLAAMPSPQLGHQHFLTFLVHDLLAEEVEFVDGNITVPTGPGLGIELDREALERYEGVYENYGEFEGYGPITPSPPYPRISTWPTDDADVRARGHQVHYSPEHAPIGTVEAGESFTVITADGFTGRYDDPADFTPETAAWIEENLDGVTGPIAVAGAEPGQAVAVTIEELEVVTKPVVVVSRCEALSPYDWWHEEDHVVNLTVADGAIRLRDDWTVPVTPLIGCLATAPARETVFSKYEGDHGGNLDVREITTGATSSSRSRPGARAFTSATARRRSATARSSAP